MSRQSTRRTKSEWKASRAVCRSIHLVFQGPLTLVVTSLPDWEIMNSQKAVRFKKVSKKTDTSLIVSRVALMLKSRHATAAHKLSRCEGQYVYSEKGGFFWMRLCMPVRPEDIDDGLSYDCLRADATSSWCLDKESSIASAIDVPVVHCNSATSERTSWMLPEESMNR